jgi:hypothetical protein
MGFAYAENQQLAPLVGRASALANATQSAFVPAQWACVRAIAAYNMRGSSRAAHRRSVASACKERLWQLAVESAAPRAKATPHLAFGLREADAAKREDVGKHIEVAIDVQDVGAVLLCAGTDQ